MHCRRFGLPLCLLFALAPCAQAADKNSPAAGRIFQAGAFAADITPLSLPISVNGSMQPKQATEVHDRLHARALVLDDGQLRIAIVVCDLCMIPRDVCDEAQGLVGRAAGISADHMLISATHTHSAAAVNAVFQAEPDPAYQHFVAVQIAKGIAQAAQNLEPARIAWGAGRNGDQVFNRRWILKPGTVPPDPFGRKSDTVKMNPGAMNPNLVEPAGPVDPEVAVLSVQARDGRPIALLANYSLHYVGGVPPISADYYGAFAERIKELLDATSAKPAFVGIMSNGTSGDVNNIDFRVPIERAAAGERIKVVADSVARTAFDATKKLRYRDWVPLAMRQREIELGVRLPSQEDVQAAEQILSAAQGPLKKVEEVYARETRLLAKYPPRVRAKLQAIRIGELGIATTPCETFAETGLAIKRESPLKPTFVIE
ncbi:MAG TPA: neutral/alkaline non-lysosomal ceramidase N-terminal domain-containing protein, partial [Pirellulales bacterium]|nr:neutral/alkaline non-lysosomal ceramidase N-terminal domain-containing protein [Pirellulales bacterium]